MKNKFFFLMFFICAYIITMPADGIAQFRDSTSRVDTIHTINGLPGYSKSDSLPKARDIAIQFLTGEAAFNVTFFALWGNDIFHQNGDAINPAGFGLLASWVTTPLAIHYVSNLLHLKSGSWGFGILGAVVGTFAGIAIFNHGQQTDLKSYLGLSIGTILFSELFYDFTIWIAPSP